MDNALELSFRDKVRAWWHGEIVPAGSTTEDPESRPENDPELNAVNTTDPDPGGTATDAQPEPNRSRLRVAQEVWGEGYLGPGDHEYVTGLAKPLNPSSEHTMLLLSAELGGPARSIAEKFGVWITAYESKELLAALGLEQSVLSGVARQVDLDLCDYRSLELPPNKFASAFWKEGLFRLADKPAMLTRIFDTLRPGGCLLITDFVKPSADGVSRSVEEWSASEPIKPVLWCAEDASAALTQCHFRVSVVEDISDKYRHVIISAWKRWLVLLPQLRKEGRLEAKFLDAMMAEIACWVHRARIIENGDLRVYRFLAFKPEESLIK